MGKKRSKRPNTTEGTPGQHLVKVPQPHGGALNAGGTPGNAGGRPPNHVRALAKAGLLKALPKVEAIAIDDKAKATDIVNATALLHKIAGDDDAWYKRPEVVAFLLAVERSIRHHAPDKADQVIADVQATLKAEGL